MEAYEVNIKKSSVKFTTDAEEARQQAIEEILDALNDGYDISEIFEIEVVECGEEPGVVEP
jgi:hypothetical protein